MATKKKTLVTQAEYSRQRGCSRPYISKLVAQGVITLSQGMVDPIEADRQIADYAAHLHDSPGPTAKGQPDDDSLMEWRKKELKAKTALKNLQLDTEKGLLINAEELKAELARLFVDIKTLLRQIPSKAAGELVHLVHLAKSEHEAQVAVARLLLAEIDEVLTQLSQWQPKSKKKGGDKGKKIGPYKRR